MTTTKAARAMPSSTAVVARRKGRRREEAVKLLFVLPAAVALVGLFGYPVVKNIWMGFQDYSLTTFFTGDAPFVGLENYRTVLGSEIFTKAAVNTALFTLGSIAGQFVIGMLLALFFQKHFPLGGVIRALFILPWLIPLIVVSASWRAIMDQDSGMINTLLMNLHVIDSPIPWLTSPSVALLSVVLVNVWLGIPFNMTLLYSGLQEIPGELYEAGELDGATGWKAFRFITWPNLRPVVTIVLTLGVVYTLKVLDIILALTRGGPANATQTIALRSYQASFVDFKFGQGAALSNILILVSLVFAGVYLYVSRRRVDE